MMNKILVLITLFSCSGVNELTEKEQELKHYSIINSTLTRELIANLEQEELLANYYQEDQIYSLDFGGLNSEKYIQIYSMKKSFSWKLYSLNPFGYSIINGHPIFLFGENNVDFFKLDNNVNNLILEDASNKENLNSILGGENAMWIYKLDSLNNLSLDKYRLLKN